MARHTLYAYVDGANLHAIAGELESRFERFVRGQTWRVRTPTIINQRHPEGYTFRRGDVAGWDLGLNLDLPDPGGEPPAWFSDVERIANFLGELNAAVGRDFVFGIGDNEQRYSEDLFYVNSPDPDLKTLRMIVGVGEPDA
jgi:hypothetical protein